MTTAILAKRMGVTVFATTRNPRKGRSLKSVGVDHVIIDDGRVAELIRRIVPEGVDAALELVGTNTLQDTLRSTRAHGVVCFTGLLSGNGLLKTSIRSTTSLGACV